MPITIACKCGRQLRAQEDHVGRQVQCPVCGRVHIVPAPASDRRRGSAWLVEATPEAARRAELAGVVEPGKANVVRLHRPGGLSATLSVEGDILCWYCKTATPFTAPVFGRTGLAGAFLTVACPQCNASIWTGFSTHATGTGTDVFLYAPTTAREYARRGDEPIPAPTLRIERVNDAPRGPGADWSEAALSGFIMAVTRHEPYQEVSARAAVLAGQLLPEVQAEAVLRNLRTLLERERRTYLRAVLAELLACLRDEAAGPAVQGALRDALAEDDASDAGDQPLQDLCVLALVYGDGNGFREAMARGLQQVTTPSRARKHGNRLTPKAVLRLVEKGEPIDSYESTLGGDNWQYLHPVLPLWVDDNAAKRGSREGWLGRLFGKK